MKKRAWWLSLLLLAVYLFMACNLRVYLGGDDLGSSLVQDKQGKIKVLASIYPLYDFANRVGGDLIEVKTIVPLGADPHSFEPSPKLLAELQEADIFIYNGLGMEPWIKGALDLLKKKDILIIRASEGLDLIRYKPGQKAENPEQGDLDPHIWMDPMNAQLIARRIKEALIEKDEDRAKDYKENYSLFEEELNQLDEDFIRALDNIANKKILVSHSAFAYLAKRYGIEEIAVSGISPHEEPSPRRLADLIKVVENNNIKYIFYETLSNPKIAETLAREAGLKTSILYNIEGLTREQEARGEDYISLMRKNLLNINKVLVD